MNLKWALIPTLFFGFALESWATPTPAIQRWCTELQEAISGLKWKVNPCDRISWTSAGTSSEGRPLVYAEFGDNTTENTTLIFATIHGDEVTPLYLAVQLALWMRDHELQFKNIKVVIAPLVNPDGFFKHPRTRMNANGVDLNRNFPTQDWPDKALTDWKSKFHSNPRRYPGSKPGSEPETLFQRELIEKIKPQKILSIHAPLNFVDYDGPTTLSLDRFPREYINQCLRLRGRLKAITSGFFPGSLGNFAGNEMGIPTLTLELPSADSKKAQMYWLKFSQGIRTMIEFQVPKVAAQVKRE